MIVLADACRIAVEKGKFRMAWIGLADETASHVETRRARRGNSGHLENFTRPAGR